MSTAPASAADGPLRVCLLSYRSKPHCGGQGIYLRHVSRELAALGHHVEVYSGQPYPELEPGPLLIELPSLDLYRDDDPFRTPHLREYRDWIDVLEVAGMWTAYFPEPLTFSLRALRALRGRGEATSTSCTTTRCWPTGTSASARLGLPIVTSIHHPISVDRRIELRAARGLRKIPKWRWYSFVGMQGRVARRIGTVMTGSESSKADILRDFKVPPDNVKVIPLGVDTRLFHPRPGPARSRQNRRRGQCRLAREGRRDAAACVREARRRTGRLAHPGQQAGTRTARRSASLASCR